MVKLPPIIVPLGAKGCLAAVLNTTYKSVAKALRGDVSTALHYKIRELALNSYNGILINS